MKNIILTLITLLSLTSCKTDNFYETERYFLTDKETYRIGDEFELTAIIESDKEKEIRFYKNFKNLHIWFTIMNEPKNIHNGSRTELSDEFLEKTDIVTFIISEGKPFKKKFTGKIERDNNQITLIIPELKYKAKISASEFDQNTRVRIHGFCNPINPEFGASLEEYIDSKDIKIVIE